MRRAGTDKTAATFHVRVNAVEAMQRLIADVTGPSLTEDGVEVYHWSQGADDPTQFLLYMEWRDRACFDAHVATSHVQRADELLGQDMLAELYVLLVYNRI
jgi:quinol monooxygenase YgiN